MITALNALPSDVYNCGQNIMIVTVKVPDLWVSEVSEENTEYVYTSDEVFVAELEENGSVQVGYYKLSHLETQKVNLTDYAKIGVFGYDDLKDKPFGIEGIEVVPTVDIPIVSKEYVGDYDVETYVYYVSDQVFTQAELLDKNTPFYIEARNQYDVNSTVTFKLCDAEKIEYFEGCIAFRKYVTASWGGSAYIIVYVVNEPRGLTLGDPYNPMILDKKGIYIGKFYEFEVLRLYRNEGEILNIKKLDNQFLDLENHPVIMKLLSKL
jgi:hypothetical protein